MIDNHPGGFKRYRGLVPALTGVVGNERKVSVLLDGDIADTIEHWDD